MCSDSLTKIPQSTHHLRDWELLEEVLLEQVRAAQQAYESAAGEHKTVVERYQNLPLDTDGASARLRAANLKIQALEKYRCALKVFSELVVHGKWPTSSSQKNQIQ